MEMTVRGILVTCGWWCVTDSTGVGMTRSCSDMWTLMCEYHGYILKLTQYYISTM